MFVRILMLFIGLVSVAEVGVAQSRPKVGAIPVTFDTNGNGVYKLIDLEPIVAEHGLTPLVYSGTRSVDGEFPEVGFLGFCTATAVGPKIIYTAAHCVSNGQRVNWKMRKNGISYPATCGKHPQYNDRTVFNDYAFCVLDGTLPEDSVFASFNISGNPQVGKKMNYLKIDAEPMGAEMLLNGFGAPNLGTHFWGKATVCDIQDQDIVTCGPASLGGGDSGGAFYKFTIERTDPRKHIIDGTNSRAGGGRSYFNSTSHPNFKPYAIDVATKAGSYICGVTKDCSFAAPGGSCADEHLAIDYLEKALLGAKDRLAMCQK